MSFLRKRRSSSGGDTSQNAKLAARGSQHQNEVFLSFCGEDTRHSFVDFLYESLNNAGIITFRDEEGLCKGESVRPELLNAIQQSSISIPIFSKRYALSKWCLWELKEMVKCRKASCQKILPVFYDVEPKKVRNQTGSYRKGFRQHYKEFSKETVEEWKEALREVGEINGWEVKKTADGHQGKITKLIVRHVLRELKKGYLNVTDYLVAIEQHVKRMLELLNADSDGSTNVVGIHGIGGIGKTTLAKTVYNRLCDRFECHSFLENIRENKLRSLQKQLISDILKLKDVSISNLDEGMTMIKERFCNKKVLILLDDVDSTEQLENLAGSRDWFGMGSKIIFTTRINNLHTFEVKLYELEQLNFAQSLQLFSKQAFRADEPPKDFLALSKRFVSTCAGLPLALEVLGSSLHGEDKLEWEYRFRSLKRRPPKKVVEKLRITYDTLTHEEQQIFLDISCHFIGMDIRIVIHFWYSLNYFPEESIQALLDKSLVKTGADFKLKMHDLLRDLGRNIANRETIGEHNTFSRVWNFREAWDILLKKEGSDKVRGLHLGPLSELRRKSEFLYGDQFTKLTNLKFLRVDCPQFEGDFHCLLPELRWLVWKACPAIDTLRNFNLENLVTLDLSWSKVTETWNGWSQIKGKNLRVLDLTACGGLTKTPNLSSYTNLERLIFGKCWNLVEIDKSIGKLKNLTFLDLRYCSQLKMLPPEVESLNALEELLIDGTSIHKLPSLEGMDTLEILHVKICSLQVVSSIGQLTALKELALDGSRITHLPDLIGLLVNLESLSLKSCWSLKEVPESIDKLKSLNELLLDSSDIFELPHTIMKLTSLQTLGLTRCPRLQSMSVLPSNLTDFRFSWYGSSLHFPSSINLRELFYARKPKLAKTVSLAELFCFYFSELEKCTFSNAYVTTLLAEFTIFKQLKQLVVTRCNQLQSISKLPSTLSCIRMHWCSSIKDLPDLSNLKNLLEISIRQCKNLREIGYLCHLPSSLSFVDLDSCPSLEKIPNLPNLSTLLKLSITRCNNLREIHGLEGLKLMQVLDVSYCRELRMLDGIEKLESLKLLDVSNCFVLRLPDISSSEQLKVHNDVHISDFEMLQKFGVNFSHPCNTVETLTLSGGGIMFLPKSFIALNCLRKLELKSLYSLNALPALPQSLVSLQARHCNDLSGWPDMSNLKNLSELVITDTMLREIQGLGELGSLTYLEIKSCYYLTTLAGLEQLMSLKHLNLSFLLSLNTLPTLPPSLASIHIYHVLL